jgi:hypothetical protein
MAECILCRDCKWWLSDDRQAGICDYMVKADRKTYGVTILLGPPNMESRDFVVMTSADFGCVKGKTR